MPTRTPTHPRGLTFAEVLVVLALGAMLGAVALPGLAGRKQRTQTERLVEDLASMRAAIDAFWGDHGAFPGRAGADELVEQLCRHPVPPDGSDDDAGPYLQPGRLPPNPITGTRAARVVDAMPAGPEGTEAWIYDASSGQVRANVVGRTVDGVRYFEL